MPLQMIFTDKVTQESATKKYPLGTQRIEGSKIYKYVKASGAITANGACQAAAAGTVALFAGVGPGCGFNATGAAITDTYYWWMQVHGEVGGLATNTGMTAVGYPVGVTNADGVTLADPTIGVTAFGNATVAVKSETAGVIYLSGLA